MTLSTAREWTSANLGENGLRDKLGGIENALRKIAENLGVDEVGIKKIPDDGNCMFTAVATSLRSLNPSCFRNITVEAVRGLAAARFVKDDLGDETKTVQVADDDYPRRLQEWSDNGANGPIPTENVTFSTQTILYKDRVIQTLKPYSEDSGRWGTDQDLSSIANNLGIGIGIIDIRMPASLMLQTIGKPNLENKLSAAIIARGDHFDAIVVKN